jgi:SPP1 gp7 family putative phage head morphogenesis protein
LRLRSPIVFRETELETVTLNENKKDKNVDNEVTLSLLEEHAQVDWETYMMNPDKLIQERGYEFIDEVIADDVYNRCHEVLNYAGLSVPWDITIDSEDNIDKRTVELLKFILEDKKGTLRDDLKEIYLAQPYGFSVTEINYKRIKEGKYKGKIGLKDLKTRLPHYIKFNRDKHGNLEGIIQDPDNLVLDEPKEIPIKKAILYVHKPQFDNPYGTPDVKFIYKPYIAKKWAIKSWNVFLDKVGIGFPYAKVPRNNDERKKEMKKIFSNLSKLGGVVLSDDITEFDFFSPSNRSNPFIDAVQEHSKAMSRGLLLPDQLGYTDTGWGSYAQAKKHFDIFIIQVKERIKATEEFIKEQLFKPLVIYDVGAKAKIANLKFNPLTEDDEFELAKAFTGLVKDGVIHPTDEDEKWARKIIGAPEIEEKTIVESKGIPEKKKFAERKRNLVGAKLFKYKETENMLNTLEAKAQQELEETIGKMRKKFDSDIEKKGLLTVDSNPDPKKLKGLSLSYLGDLKGTLYKYLSLAYLNSKHTAFEEIRASGNLPKALAEKYSELEKFSMEGSFGLSVDEAYKYFTGKIPITRSELEYYNTRAFTITGVLEKDVLGEAQIILSKQFQRNDKIWAKTQLRKLWEKYEATGEITDAGKLKTAHRLETIRRTNMSEAMNFARYNMFMNKEVRKILKGFQIDAVMDDRTTDHCSSIDGNIYHLAEFVQPPYHYNCRTTFTPVYYYEEVKFSDWKASPYEGFSEIEKLGFAGPMIKIAA